ncbi:MAG: alpha/beta hydrolase [Betaproteobacteria bacterium]|nr:alpha/beta hydrolase [Betaproteobacteria bacterium]
MNAPDAALLAREYNNRQLVPDHARYFARWQEDSARARSRMNAKLDLRYGDSPGETLDLFPARGGDGACMMFIHGGYWRSLDKSDFSFLAPAWVDAGVSLAVVNYDLCPKVAIEEIVRQMLRASRWLRLNAGAHGIDPDRLYVFGHSAGGHLAAMLLAAIFPALDPRLPKELWKGALAISGVYDLRPLVGIDFLQPDLRLDEESALRVSPAFLPPATSAPVMTCVGGDESGEFHRQNALLGRNWESVLAEDVPMPGRNHFSVMDALGEPSSALFAAACRLMNLRT